jgi:hypothetical protein
VNFPIALPDLIGTGSGPEISVVEIQDARVGTKQIYLAKLCFGLGHHGRERSFIPDIQRVAFTTHLCCKICRDIAIEVSDNQAANPFLPEPSTEAGANPTGTTRYHNDLIA